MEILLLLGFRLLNKYSLVHHVGPLYYWLTKRGRRKFWEPKLWGSLGKPKHWKKIFFSINFTQIFRICPKMFQFLKYLLHKQIIEMCHSQNLRRPLSVPCPTQWCSVPNNWSSRWIQSWEALDWDAPEHDNFRTQIFHNKQKGRGMTKSWKSFTY